MARVPAHRYTREVERQEKIMIWATIYNQPTFQFGEILIQERRGKDLKQGQNRLAKFGNQLRTLRFRDQNHTSVTHR